jgi:hypothetical protein
MLLQTPLFSRWSLPLINWSHEENISSSPAQAELFASNSVKLAPLAAGEACVLDRIEPSLFSLGIKVYGILYFLRELLNFLPE